MATTVYLDSPDGTVLPLRAVSALFGSPKGTPTPTGYVHEWAAPPLSADLTFAMTPEARAWLLSMYVRERIREALRPLVDYAQSPEFRRVQRLARQYDGVTARFGKRRVVCRMRDSRWHVRAV